jgi:type III pantothenate kinase
MLLMLDAGNTDLKVALEGRDGPRVIERIPSARAAARGLAEALESVIARDGSPVDPVNAIVLVSVAPRVTERVREFAAGRGVELIEVTAASIPIPVRVPEPWAVGADRLVNAFAASRLHGTPAIVVDAGTATTFDVVAADGAYVGGAIAPGLRLGIDALARGTAMLPPVPLHVPQRAIATSTVEAIQSGAVLGHVAMIEGLVARIAAELGDGGSSPRVVLTGGYSALPWAAAVSGVDAVDPLLTLRGLALLAAARQPAAA